MRSFLQSSKKYYMIITAGALLSAAHLQSQVAETATVILPQIVQLAAAVLYHAATAPHHQQQAQFTQTPSSASYSFPNYGSSTASDPLGAIRYSGVQNLRQNKEVFGLIEGYKTQFPPFAHGPAYPHVGSGFNVPHEHHPSQPASPTTPDFSIPVPQGFGLPSLPSFFSQPTMPHINIPYVQGEFRIAPPDIGPRDTGFSFAFNVRRNVPMATSADYIIPVPRHKAHSFLMQDPDYAANFSNVVWRIIRVLLYSNTDLVGFPTLTISRLKLVEQIIESGNEGDFLDDALLDLTHLFFNQDGDLISTTPSDEASLIILQYIKHIYNSDRVASIIKGQGMASSKFYSDELIQRSIRGEKPTVNHVANLYNFTYKILSNKNNQILKRISDLFSQSVNKDGSVNSANKFYDAEDLMDYLSPYYQSIAQKFIDKYCLHVQTKAPDIYKQITTIDQYGIKRIYSNDPRWFNLSKEQKRQIALSHDSQVVMNSLLELRKSIGDETIKTLGIDEKSLSEMPYVIKAIWDLVDHTVHPSELSQARIAQAFDPKTYRFKHGGNEKLEELLKKAFDSEEEFKEKVNTFANKPEIPYSPQDLNEPPLEHKPKAQPATPQNGKPEGSTGGQQTQSAQPTPQPHEPAPAKSEAETDAMPHVHCASLAPIPHVDGDEEDDVVDLDKESNPFGSSFDGSGGPKNGTDPHGGGFSTTGGSDNDEDEKLNCHDETKEINQSDKILSEFIRQHKKLPNNYITKAQARNLGWNPKLGNLNTVAPDKIIGGDIFNNAEKLLPDAPGRIWYEADLGYKSGFRGCERIIFSSDGLIYKTVDHYKSFIKID